MTVKRYTAMLISGISGCGVAGSECALARRPSEWAALPGAVSLRWPVVDRFPVLKRWPSGSSIRLDRSTAGAEGEDASLASSPSLVVTRYDLGQGLLGKTCLKSFVRWIGVNPGPG
jgi:hypothetical protein